MVGGLGRVVKYAVAQLGYVDYALVALIAKVSEKQLENVIDGQRDQNAIVDSFAQHIAKRLIHKQIEQAFQRLIQTFDCVLVAFGQCSYEVQLKQNVANQVVGVTLAKLVDLLE
jgi:hypothetical protein